MSDNNFHLNIQDSKGLVFDGNIYNPKGFMEIKNSNLSFQGHPMVHASIDEQTLKNLQKLGQTALTKGVSLTQEDWENRIFTLKEINLENTELKLGSYANLQTEKLYAKNSNVILGSNLRTIDELDTQNIYHNNNIEDYGYDYFTGIGKEMFYKQEIKSKEESPIKEVYFKGNLILDDSNAFI